MHSYVAYIEKLSQRHLVRRIDTHKGTKLIWHERLNFSVNMYIALIYSQFIVYSFSDASHLKFDLCEHLMVCPDSSWKTNLFLGTSPVVFGLVRKKPSKRSWERGWVAGAELARNLAKNMTAC